MAHTIRSVQPTHFVKTLMQTERSLRGTCLRAAQNTLWHNTLTIPRIPQWQQCSRLHTSQPTQRKNESTKADFSQLDVLGSAPVPATSIDVCMSDGFALNSGSKIMDGSGMILVGGDAFAWRPWLASKTGDKKLINAKGQWEVPEETLSLFGLVWPRPDLLIIGLGPEMRPLSPATRRHISSLGMRVEILDTRNAASQFNLLATERGVDVVAAALIPIGWKEGIGAS